MILFKPMHWEDTLHRLEALVGEDVYNAWLKDLSLEDFSDDGVATILTPTSFYTNWIEKRYLKPIEQAFSEAVGQTVTVRLQTGDDGHKPNSETDVDEVDAPSAPSGRRIQTVSSDFSRGRGAESLLAPSTGPSIVGNAMQAHRRTTQPAPKLMAKFTFDEFVVGESNRFAAAAAQAVSSPTAGRFDALFIYGGSGLGKTHLMHAIGHALYEADPTNRVLYITSEQFINDFINSVQNRRHAEFRAQYRNVDLLMIDDVQFLMGKDRTQLEFFHTFNALYDAGKKLVLSSDRPPKELTTLEERLRSRFGAGLLVDIQAPDLETRVAILRKKAMLEGIKLSNDVIMFVAERMNKNVREMEGALKRLGMAATLHDRPIDLEVARDVLSHLMVGQPAAQISVEDVQRAVCEYFKIKMSDLLGSNRAARFSKPRHIAMALSRKLTSLSFPDIAQKFGGKDHTSIIYACRRMEAMVAADTNAANIMDYLSRQVTKGAADHQ